MKVAVKYDLTATVERENGNKDETRMEVENVQGAVTIYREEKVIMVHFLFLISLLFSIVA